MRRALLAIGLVSLLGCAAEPGHLIEGRLLDAETGEPVSRARVYVHLFCDEIGFQKSLEPEDETTYSARLPRPKVRVRVAGGGGLYRLFEETVEIEGGSLEYDVRLVPTHYVLLRGRAIDAATGKALVPGKGMGDGPILYFDAESAGWKESLVWLEDDGTFEVRAPRAKVTIRAVDTAKRIRNPVVDLTGYEGDERGVELLFE